LGYTVNLVIKKGTLRWFGHVEHKDDVDWIKRCTTMETDGTRQTGRPRKTWWDSVRKCMKPFSLFQEDAQD